MRALTVQQPWAWAIIHGGKDVENRTQLWSYRGPLAIHAGQRWSQRGAQFRPLQEAYAAWLGFTHWSGPFGGHTAMPIDPDSDPRDAELIDFAAIIGVVDLVDAHHEAGGCCQPWGESSYVEHGGRRRRAITHLRLENARALPVPLPCRGALGLWTPPGDLLEQLQEVAA